MTLHGIICCPIKCIGEMIFHLWKVRRPACGGCTTGSQSGSAGRHSPGHLLPVGRAAAVGSCSAAHSGGIAIDMGVHEFDQLRWLTGQDITSLAVVTSGQAPDGIADVDGAQVIADAVRRRPPGSSRSAVATRRATSCGPRRSAPGQRALRRHRPRPRARRPSSRRCGGRRRASLCTLAAGALRGRHGRRRGRGADRRRAGHAPPYPGEWSVALNAGPCPAGSASVGYGVMGKAHSYGYRVAPMLRPPAGDAGGHRDVRPGRQRGRRRRRPRTACPPPSPTGAELIERDDVDIVDICTPPGTHAADRRGGRGGGQGGAVREAAGHRPTPEAARGAAACRRGRGARTRSASTTGGCLPSALMTQHDRRGRRSATIRLWRGELAVRRVRRPGDPVRLALRPEPWAGRTIADLGSHLIDLAS